MPRPTKFRRVDFFPDETYFVPLGKSKCDIEEVNLKVEELEAMRLKDIEGLNQEECAEKMEISRQTFQNIIDSARQKVAEALTQGKAIKIGGGHYTSKHCKLKCMDCNAVYEINSKEDQNTCPSCNSKNIGCIKRMESCEKWCRKK